MHMAENSAMATNGTSILREDWRGPHGNYAGLGLTREPRQVLRTDFNETLETYRTKEYVVYGWSSK